MTTLKALHGKLYAGNPHVCFDEGKVALAAKPSRGSQQTLSGIILAGVVITCAASALADYTINSDTTYGDGSMVTWGADPFTGNFVSDFSSDVDSLTFANRIHLNGNNVVFNVPLGKTLYLPGGVASTTASKDSNVGGEIVRVADYRGTLVVSNGIDKTRLSLKFGTTVIDDGNRSGVTNVLNYCNVWNVATVVFNGGAYESYGEIYMGSLLTFSITNCYLKKVANSAHNGALNVGNGTFRAVNSVVDFLNGATLTIGGIYSSDTAQKATYEMDGGTLLVYGRVYVGKYGTGTFNFKGGIVKYADYSQDWPQIIGDASSAIGTLNISGGEWQVWGAPWGANDGKCSVEIGRNGSGTVNVAGTGVFSLVPGDAGSKNCRAKIYVAKNAGSTGIVNLNEGGTFLTWGYGLIGGEGTSSLVFNGGTFRKPSEATTGGNYVETNLTIVAVGAKGGVVDTGNKNMKFCDPIVDLDPTAESTGFFSKRGSGTLTFYGENTYKTPTRVEAGKIALADDGAFSPNSTLYVDAGATADFASASQTIGGIGTLAGTLANVTDLVFAGETQPGGAETVGSTALSCDSLTFAEGSKLVVDVDAGGNCDILSVTTSSPIDISNLTIEVHDIDGVSRIGPVLSATNGLLGKPRLVGSKRKTVSVVGGKVYLAKPGFCLILR